MIDIDESISKLRRCELLAELEVRALCDLAKEILIDDSNVQRVSAPVTVSYIHTYMDGERDMHNLY